jgi:hypothetical protein
MCHQKKYVAHTFDNEISDSIHGITFHFHPSFVAYHLRMNVVDILDQTITMACMPKSQASELVCFLLFIPIISATYTLLLPLISSLLFSLFIHCKNQFFAPSMLVFVVHYNNHIC